MRDGCPAPAALFWILRGGMARLAAAALALERVTPFPAALERRVGHPVVWIGRSIEALERRWNCPERSAGVRRRRGIATVLATAAAAALAGAVGQQLGPAIAIVLAHPGLAQRSLDAHVEAVRRPLATGDLAEARLAVARIVGRDTAALDEAGVARAALESLAESFNDGVVAPAFWLLVAGLPGLYVYKAVNTADSLIGHMEPRWRAFGWAAARLDDVMNLAPARIAGALIALSGGRGWRIMGRDGRRHASPNAGWPEAAMAGALGVRLGGPVRYDGVEAARPWLGDGPAPRLAELARGLIVYRRACTLLLVTVALTELALSRRRRVRQ